MISKRALMRGVLAGAAAAVCPAPSSAANVDGLHALLRVGQDLDERNISDQGRWIVIPTWMGVSIRKELPRWPELNLHRSVMIDRFRVCQQDYMHPDYVLVGHESGIEHINTTALLAR